MTDILLRLRSVERSTSDLRLSAIQRRVSLSPSLADVIADLAYGARERDHAEVIHLATRARVADAAGAR